MGPLALNRQTDAAPSTTDAGDAARDNRAQGVPVRLIAASGAPADASSARVQGALQAHFGIVWRMLRRLGVEESAVDDAAQHVFLTFMARASEIPEARERSFLIGIAVRVAANARRRRERSDAIRSDAELRAGSAPTPEELMDWKQRRELLDRGLAELLEEQRSVFVLYELEGE
jgi:RNA polymerase sigma-70 factor (ECF subfamily)